MFATNIKESLVDENHTSEGFIVKLSDGDILHIFRFAAGEEGNHVSNGGYIAKRRYNNGAWGNTEVVYDSGVYDDRNIHGGITNEGRIVVFFRRYDASTEITEGCYFIYSDDDGSTWSSLNLMDIGTRNTIVYGTGQMFYNPEINKYCIVGYISNYCEIRFSVDGSNWDEKVVIAEATNYHLSEIAGAYCGNGRMIVIERDDDREYNHPLLQMISVDNGQTWSEPTQTNIPPDNLWGCAPQLLWDEENDLLIAMNSDRRGYHGESKAEESLYIFYAKPIDVFSNSKNWVLGANFIRPKINSEHNFYGYPTYAKVESNHYFVVFSDGEWDDVNEDVDLYQFDLYLSDGIPKKVHELNVLKNNGGLSDIMFLDKSVFIVKPK